MVIHQSYYLKLGSSFGLYCLGRTNSRIIDPINVGNPASIDLNKVCQNKYLFITLNKINKEIIPVFFLLWTPSLNGR